MRDLIEAFAIAHSRVPEARLHLAGTPIGPAKGTYVELTRRIDELSLGDAIRLSGWHRYESLPNLYAASDVFVLPSKRASDGSKEGVPNVVLEAMAIGLPVVSTRHAGIPTAVADGETGVLVDEGDVTTLAAALTALAQDPNQRALMGAAGRERVEQSFDIRDQRKRLEASYRQVLDGASPSGSRR